VFLDSSPSDPSSSPEAERVRRLFRTLVACNHIQVRSGNIAQLLNEICHCIVTTGGFQLAWVGYPEADEGQTIRPVARSGQVEACLEAVQASWGLNQQGMGVVGEAIRSGEPQLVQNIYQHAAFDSWQSEAAQFGILSAASFPLFVEDEIIGALNVYAGKENAFDEDAVALFMELSGNLAYGISSLRVEEERRVALDLLRQSEERLAKAHQAAVAANQAKSEFLSTMSHELRTPLNAILGFGQLMEGDPGDPLSASQAENLAQILRAGWHLLNLINEILDVARIEAGKMTVHLEDILLSEVVAECLGLVIPLAAERSIRVQNQVGAFPLRYVQADLMRFKQILLNFLSNAVKYNCERGELSVACERVQSGRLRISVSDTGMGIPPERIDQLFMPFNRLGAERTPTQGSGIGLAVAKRLAEMMGGEIGVSSEPGKGSTFWVELLEVFPADENLAELKFPKADEAGDAVISCLGTNCASGEMTLLYIEDNRANRDLIGQVLQQLRPCIRMEQATTAEHGLEMAISHPPDLILMDIHLPGISGLDALGLLREFDTLRQIPVIAISADTSPEKIESGLASGFFDYLPKPIDVLQFLRCVDRAINPCQKGASQ
jgi:signal transduction histidine kinase/ActR/RegA family two-component response regulator